LASGLGPVYVRVSGTWANTTYFQDNDEPKLDKAPDGFENVLTRNEWKGVVDFCKEIDGKIVTSFAISDGIRDNQGNWTPAQIEPLINYTKSIGGEIAAASLFNEPSHAEYGGAPEGYDASYYTRDFQTFKSYINQALPEMKILGPGSTGEGGIIPVAEAMTTEKILSADPMPVFDIFSYHFYGTISRRCRGEHTPEEALTEDWLTRTELGLQYYQNARDQFLPGTPIWLTETGEAACGGNPWAATYIDSFRYLEQLGRLAKKGVQVVMHNTLAASEYALLDHATHDPRPSYWAALLWSQLMGTEVYHADTLASGVDVFVHNLKNSATGKAALIINTKETGLSFQIPVEARQYLITAESLLTKEVLLNGDPLTLNPDGSLPQIQPMESDAGNIQLPPHSILYLAFDNV